MDRSLLAVPGAAAVALASRGLAPLPPDAATMLAITLFCIVLWVADPVPPWFVGLVCIGLVGVAFSPSLALSGFGLSATWLIVVGAVVGRATRRSGLGEFAQTRLLARLRASAVEDARRLYLHLLAVLSAGALALALLLPSAIVRVLVLAPLLAEVGEGFESKRARLGLFLGPLLTTWYGGAGILTANLPNIVTVGVLESTTDATVTWSEWFALLFPITGVARMLVIAGVVYYLYRPAPRTAVRLPGDPDRSTTGEERRMLAFLLLGVTVWATDFLHGLHPLFGALLVATLALAPPFGVLSFDQVGEIDFSIVFFVGAVFAIAEGLQRTGFTDTAARSLLALVPADAGLPLVALAVFLFTGALMVLMEGVAVASVLTPVVATYAQQAGLPVLPVVFAEVLALDTLYFLPFQSIVLVTILGQGVVETRDLVVTTTACTLLITVLLVPLQFLVLLWLT
ncbi:SLC13 family permease [Haloglomus litoreum]|uniref:SLC13 family permease n=1 Tax=Haloglomus litoreum TaxID=3034026 RepID=UPI0023E77678|nr:SLC13 family permease [Haloglomus sp. DT116]